MLISFVVFLSWVIENCKSALSEKVTPFVQNPAMQIWTCHARTSVSPFQSAICVFDLLSGFINRLFTPVGSDHSNLPLSLPAFRQYRVSGDDGRSLFLGRPVGQGGPQTMPADIHVGQRLLRLPLFFCPRLQYVPLLPHGVWLWVSSLFSSYEYFSCFTSRPPQCVWGTEAPLRASPSPAWSALLAVSFPPKSKHMTRGYSNCLAPAHPPPLSGWEGTKQNKNVCRNKSRIVNEHLSVLALLWSAWLPTPSVNNTPADLHHLTSLFIHDL